MNSWDTENSKGDILRAWERYYNDLLAYQEIAEAQWADAVESSMRTILQTVFNPASYPELSGYFPELINAILGSGELDANMSATEIKDYAEKAISFLYRGLDYIDFGIDQYLDQMTDNPSYDTEEARKEFVDGILSFVSGLTIPIPDRLIREKMQPFFDAIGEDVDNYITEEAQAIVEESDNVLQALREKYADYAKYPHSQAFNTYNENKDTPVVALQSIFKDIKEFREAGASIEDIYDTFGAFLRAYRTHFNDNSIFDSQFLAKSGLSMWWDDFVQGYEEWQASNKREEMSTAIDEAMGMLERIEALKKYIADFEKNGVTSSFTEDIAKLFGEDGMATMIEALDNNFTPEAIIEYLNQRLSEAIGEAQENPFLAMIG